MSAPRPVTAVRYFVLQPGVAWLRERGAWSTLLDRVSPPTVTMLQTASVRDWIPIAMLLEVDRALESLPTLAASDHVEIGKVTGRAVTGTVLRTALSLAGRLGLRPDQVARHVAQFWERSVEGGRVDVERVGDRQIRFWHHHNPRNPGQFYRRCTLGIYLSSTEPFGRGFHVRLCGGADPLGIEIVDARVR